jgi:hypothetical protein
MDSRDSIIKDLENSFKRVLELISVTILPVTNPASTTDQSRNENANNNQMILQAGPTST